jgi:hypothetical protein
MHLKYAANDRCHTEAERAYRCCRFSGNSHQHVKLQNTSLISGNKNRKTPPINHSDEDAGVAKMKPRMTTDILEKSLIWVSNISMFILLNHTTRAGKHILFIPIHLWYILKLHLFKKGKETTRMHTESRPTLLQNKYRKCLGAQSTFTKEILGTLRLSIIRITAALQNNQ